MRRLRCDACGNSDITKIDADTFQCKYCQCKYTTQAVRMMISEPVEIVKGNAELERELKAAKKLAEIGEREQAERKYQKLTTEYPHDYRVWLEYALLRAPTPNYGNICFFGADYELYKKAMLVADESEKAIAKQQWHSVWSKMVPLVESNQRPIRISAKKLTEACHIKIDLLSNLNDIYPMLSNVFAKGVSNAKVLNEAGISTRSIAYRDDCEWTRSIDGYSNKFYLIYSHLKVNPKM